MTTLVNFIDCLFPNVTYKQKEGEETKLDIFLNNNNIPFESTSKILNVKHTYKLSQIG